MPLLRHILSILAGSRSDDPIRTQMKKSHRYRDHDRRQRSTPVRVTARQCPTRRPAHNWKSLKRWFAWPQPADPKMTKLHSRFNPNNKFAKPSDTKGPPAEESNWTTWDEDVVKRALQEEGHGNEAITLVYGYPRIVTRPACRVSNKKPHLPIPTSTTKMGQVRIPQAPLTPLNTSIKPVKPLTPFRTTPRCISFQSTNGDTSPRSLRSSTPGLTESPSCASSASSSPVSTPRSGSSFQVPSDCTLTTTLLQTPSPPPTVPKDSSPIPVYQPVFRPATPCPAQRSPPRVISQSITLMKAFPTLDDSGPPIHAPSPWRTAACSPAIFRERNTTPSPTSRQELPLFHVPA